MHRGEIYVDLSQVCEQNSSSSSSQTTMCSLGTQSQKQNQNERETSKTIYDEHGERTKFGLAFHCIYRGAKKRTEMFKKKGADMRVFIAIVMIVSRRKKKWEKWELEACDEHFDRMLPSC